VLGQKIVILGSAIAVNDLMEQRGNVYSDRASTQMIELSVLSIFLLEQLTDNAQNEGPMAIFLAPLRRLVAPQAEAHAFAY
jgi:hypothetical protein